MTVLNECFLFACLPVLLLFVLGGIIIVVVVMNMFYPFTPCLLIVAKDDFE